MARIGRISRISFLASEGLEFGVLFRLAAVRFSEVGLFIRFVLLWRKRQARRLERPTFAPDSGMLEADLPAKLGATDS